MIPQGSSVNALVNNEEWAEPGKTYAMDLASMQIGGMVDGLVALKQAVYKILSTERYAHMIYSSGYGIERNGLIGMHPAVLRSEAARRIREALLQDDRIEAVEDMEVVLEGTEAKAAFTVRSVYGDFAQEVVLHV